MKKKSNQQPNLGTYPKQNKPILLICFNQVIIFNHSHRKSTWDKELILMVKLNAFRMTLGWTNRFLGTCLRVFADGYTRAKDPPWMWEAPSPQAEGSDNKRGQKETASWVHVYLPCTGLSASCLQMCVSIPLSREPKQILPPLTCFCWAFITEENTATN